MGKARNTTMHEDTATPAVQEQVPPAAVPEEDPAATPAAPVPEEDPTATPAAPVPEGDPTAPEGDDESLPEGVVAVNHVGGLNLREGPGLSFDVLEILPDGAHLTVLPLPCGAEVPGYALVKYEGGEHSEEWPLVGWVNTDFVRED